MRIVIVGCGRVGSTVAVQLSEQGHEVTVIDQQSSAFDNLPADFRGRTIVGDILAKNVLRRAEVEEADALAALTSSDSLNALVAHIAKTEYRIARVVARNYDPRQLRLQEAFDVPIVGSASWGAKRVEELLTGEMIQTAVVDQSAGVAVYRVEVPGHWNGRPPREVLGPLDAIGLTWSRGGKPVASDGADVLRPGDILYLSLSGDRLKEVQRQLVSPEKAPE